MGVTSLKHIFLHRIDFFFEKKREVAISSRSGAYVGERNLLLSTVRRSWLFVRNEFVVRNCEFFRYSRHSFASHVTKTQVYHMVFHLAEFRGYCYCLLGLVVGRYSLPPVLRALRLTLPFTKMPSNGAHGPR